MLQGYTTELLSLECGCPDEIEAIHQKQVQVLIRDSKHRENDKNMWLSEGSRILSSFKECLMNNKAQ